MVLPWLPPGRTMVLPGRGEMFYRHHQHPDPTAPTLLLLHGWTASADLQFFTAYEALAAEHSFIAIDHRGHGKSDGTRAFLASLPSSLPKNSSLHSECSKIYSADSAFSVG